MHQFVGRWRIKSMELWDQGFVDLVEPAHFRFGTDELGVFVFGAVQGQIDYCVCDDGARVEYSWAGSDDGDERSGRGWFRVLSPGLAQGRFFIHCGDESGVEIEQQV